MDNFAQRIYFNDKPLILTTDREAYIAEYPAAANYMMYDGATARSFTSAIQQLEKPGITGAIVDDISATSLLDQLNAMYRRIDAGGGLVYNEQGDILMIFRKGKWDLPKGKLDEGENISECALREVKEETGLIHLQLGEKLCNTYHIYFQNNEQILKCSSWYKMSGSSSDKLKPQKEENILEARWVSRSAVPALALKSYEAIREVLRAADF